MNINTLKAQIARHSLEAKQDVVASVSERVETLQAERTKIETKIDAGEDEALELQTQFVVEKNKNDKHEIAEDAQRVAAKITRDRVQLETVNDEQKEQLDQVLDVETESLEVFEAVKEMDGRLFEAVQLA